MASYGFEPDANGCNDKDLVEGAVQRLLSNEHVRLSDRNRRFLEFVVGETLAGRGNRIKAYGIGVDVFGRGENFDPNSDPIVRIEATRLRAALVAYYDGPGRDDPVRIVVRPGSYAPIFVNAHALPAPYASPMSRNSLIVEHLTPSDDKCAVARGSLLVDAIIGKLVALGTKVYLKTDTQKWPGNALPSQFNDTSSLYKLSVTAHEIAEGKRYSWILTNVAFSEICHVDHVDLHGHNAPAGSSIDAIVDRVVASIEPLLR